MENVFNSIENLGTLNKFKDDNIFAKSLGQDDFLKLMVTQLQNQDPLKPEDQAEFMMQTAMMQSIDQLTGISEGIAKLSKAVDSVLSGDSLISGASLIGKEVTYSGNYTDLKDASAVIRFEVEGEPSRVDVSIIDATGSEIAKLAGNHPVSGKNMIKWDGKGINGEMVPEGKYAFDVQVFDSADNPLVTKTYATGMVTGVSNDGNKLSFNVNGNVVGLDGIFSVNKIDEGQIGG